MKLHIIEPLVPEQALLAMKPEHYSSQAKEATRIVGNMDVDPAAFTTNDYFNKNALCIFADPSKASYTTQQAQETLDAIIKATNVRPEDLKSRSRQIINQILPLQYVKSNLHLLTITGENPMYALFFSDKQPTINKREVDFGTSKIQTPSDISYALHHDNEMNLTTVGELNAKRMNLTQFASTGQMGSMHVNEARIIYQDKPLSEYQVDFVKDKLRQISEKEY